MHLGTGHLTLDMLVQGTLLDSCTDRMPNHWLGYADCRAGFVICDLI